MAYGEKYEGRFKDVDNNDYRVVILEDGYDGSVETITLATPPIVTEYDYSGDALFSPIIASMTTIKVIVDSTFKFRDFLVPDDERFIVKIVLNQNTTIWTGAIFPDQYKEDYTGTPWIAKIKASDGLSILKQKYLPSYEDRFSCIRIIHACLNKMPDELYNGEIFELIKSYHDGITSSDSKLNNVNVDRANYTEKSNENPDGKDLSCYQILREIVKMFGARLQKGFANRFEIFEAKYRAESDEFYKYINAGSPITSQIGNSYDIDFSGDYQRSADRFPLFNNQNLYALAPVTAIEVEAEAAHSNGANLLRNGNFRGGADSNGVPVGWTAVGDMVTLIRNKTEDSVHPNLNPAPERGVDSRGGKPSGGGYYWTETDDYKNTIYERQPLQTTWLIINGNGGGKSNNKSQSDRADYIESDPVAVGSSVNLILYYELFFQKPWDLDKNEKIVKYPFTRCSIILEGTSGTTYYVNIKSGGNGYEFVAASNTPFTYVTIFPSNNNSDNEVEVQASTPESGDVKVRIHGYGSHTYRDANGNKKFLRVDEAAISNLSLSIESEGSYILRKRMSNNINYSLRDLSLDVIHLDSNAQIASTGELTYNENPTKDWKHDTSDEQLSVIENLARIYLEAYSKPLRVIEGTFSLKPGGLFNLNLDFYKINDNKSNVFFIVNKRKINWQEGWAWMEMIEIESISTFLPIVDFREDTASAIPRGTTTIFNNDVNEDGSDTDLNNDKYDTPHTSAVWSKTDNDRHFEGTEPADPPNGESVEWVSDGTEEGYSAGEKWMKYTDSSGTTTTTKLSN